MTINFKKIVLLVFVLVSMTVSGGASLSAKTTPEFDWEPIMAAIIHVESRGDSRAVSGVSCGAMQITPILVQECNNILESRGKKKRYTLNDRFSVAKSKEMFLLIQSHHNPTNDVERAIRMWNGGNRYKIRSTDGYYRKVLAAMK